MQQRGKETISPASRSMSSREMTGSAEALLPDVPNDSAGIGEVKAEPRCTPAQEGVVIGRGPDRRDFYRGNGPRPGQSLITSSVRPRARISPCGPMTVGLTYRTESGRRRADAWPGPWEGPRDEEFILGSGQAVRTWGRLAPLASS